MYSDGSYRDAKFHELARGGWAFVIIDANGNTVAAAYGVPPPSIEGIEGAEAWGLYQSLLYTIPDTGMYWPDCLPLITMMQKSGEAAKDPKNRLARIHGMFHTALIDAPKGAVGWMPAHVSDRELRHAMKSDGTPVLKKELEANKLADELAKRAVALHRVMPGDVRNYADKAETTMTRAIWVAKATVLANNVPLFPHRDSEAARWKAVAAARKREDKKQGIDGRRKQAKLQRPSGQQKADTQ